MSDEHNDAPLRPDFGNQKKEGPAPKLTPQSVDSLREDILSSQDTLAAFRGETMDREVLSYLNNASLGLAKATEHLQNLRDSIDPDTVAGR